MLFRKLIPPFTLSGPKYSIKLTQERLTLTLPQLIKNLRQKGAEMACQLCHNPQ